MKGLCAPRRRKRERNGEMKRKTAGVPLLLLALFLCLSSCGGDRETGEKPEEATPETGPESAFSALHADLPPCEALQELLTGGGEETAPGD